MFPGCRHATFVDVHHLRGRAGRDPHTANNLVTLCCAHHRALHRGVVIVEGSPATGLVFRHADGEVRRVLAQQRQTAVATSLEALLRDALRELTERRVSKVA